MRPEAFSCLYIQGAPDRPIPYSRYTRTGDSEEYEGHEWIVYSERVKLAGIVRHTMTEGLGEHSESSGVLHTPHSPHQPSCPKPANLTARRRLLQENKDGVESFNDVYRGSRLESMDNLAARKKALELKRERAERRSSKGKHKLILSSIGKKERDRLEPLPLSGVDKEQLRKMLTQGIDRVVTVLKLTAANSKPLAKPKPKRLRVACGTLHLEDLPPSFKFAGMTVKLKGLYPVRTLVTMPLHDAIQVSLNSTDYTVTVFDPVIPHTSIKMIAEDPHVLEAALRGMVGQIGAANLYSDIAVAMPPKRVAFNRDYKRATEKWVAKAAGRWAVRRLEAEKSLGQYAASTRIFNVYGDHYMGGKPGGQYAQKAIKKAAGEITSITDMMKFREAQKALELPGLSVMDHSGKVIGGGTVPVVKGADDGTGKIHQDVSDEDLGSMPSSFGTVGQCAGPKIPGGVPRISEFGERSGDILTQPSLEMSASNVSSASHRFGAKRNLVSAPNSHDGNMRDFDLPNTPYDTHSLQNPRTAGSMGMSGASPFPGPASQHKVHSEDALSQQESVSSIYSTASRQAMFRNGGGSTEVKRPAGSRVMSEASDSAIAAASSNAGILARMRGPKESGARVLPFG